MKDFLLIANTNACTYKEFFPLLKERKVSMGVEMPKEYDMPDGTTKKFGNICWYTTLPTPVKRKLVLTKKYKHDEYPHYDNYNAIEVGRIKDIPYDYDCVMGVPITIFQYDLDNVEVMKDTQPIRPIRKKIVIMGMAAGAKEITGLQPKTDTARPILDGVALYARVLIRRKQK